MDYIADDLEGEAPCEFCGELYPLILLIEHQSIHMTGEDDYSYLDDLLTHENVAQDIIADNLGLSTKPEVIVEKSQQSAIENEPKRIFEQKQQSPVKNKTNSNEKSSAIAAQNPDYSKTKASDESVKTEQKRSTSESYDRILYSEFYKRRRILSSSSSSEESDDDFVMGEPKDVELDGDDQISVNELKDVKKFPEQKGKEFITEKGEKLLVYGDEIDPDKEMENEKPAYKMPSNPLLSSMCQNEDVEDINNLSDDDCNESLEEFWKRARDFLKRNRARNETG